MLWENSRQKCFHEYFTVFTGVKSDIHNPNTVFDIILSLCMNKGKNLEWIKHNKAPFDNYNNFVKYCMSHLEEE